MVYFNHLKIRGAYEFSKDFVFKAVTFLERKQIISNGSPIPFKEQIVNGFCGGLASFCAISANNPLEVLRIRLQLLDTSNKRHKEYISNTKNIYWTIAKKIIKEEGWRGFYKGLKVRMFVMIPTAVISMSGYETVKSWSEL
jgi:hypothetical protein